MLKDITIGQYFPGKSVVHRLDPRFKIIITAVFIVALFCADNFLGLAVSCVFLTVSFLISEIPLRLMMKSLKPIVPIILFTTVLNLFFLDGVTFFKLGFIKITYEGLETSAFMIIRIIALIMGSSLLT